MILQIEKTNHIKASKDAEIAPNPIDIVLAEDSIGDQCLTEIALKKTNIPHYLTTYRNGDLLLPALVEQREQNKKLLPDLLLLDIGLPGRNGIDILAELAQSSPSIRSIPIVILTNYSDLEYICSKQNNLFIVSYLRKPCDPAILKIIMENIRRYKFPN